MPKRVFKNDQIIGKCGRIIGKYDRIIGKCGRILVFRKITIPFTHQTRFDQILANFTEFFRIFQKIDVIDHLRFFCSTQIFKH
jgi:hypothetical protein